MYKSSTMKNIILLLLISFTTVLQAQLIDENAFVKTNYIEAGINSCGIYGAGPVPAGYVPTDSAYRSIICDFGMDGWDEGSPFYTSDLITPYFHEGFALQKGNDPIHIYNNGHADCTYEDFYLSEMNYTESGDSISVTWSAIKDGMRLRQVSTFFQDKRYIINRITILNTGIYASIPDIFYVRDILAFPEFKWTGEENSLYTIEQKFPEDDASLISCKGLTTPVYFSIGSKNPHAYVALNFSGNTHSATDYNNFKSDYYSVINGDTIGSGYMNIVFFEPALLPGDSVQFSFAYMFAEEEVEEALAKTIDPLYTFDCIPVDIEFVEIYPGAVELAWNFHAGHDYFLQWKESSTDEFNSTEKLTEGNLILGYLTPCTDYDIKMLSVCQGDSVFTNIESFKTNCADLIEDPLNEKGIRISPNPSTGELTIQLPESPSGKINLRIVDLAGKIVYEESPLRSPNMVIDLSYLSNGAYMLFLENGGVRIHEKIIVSK